jgi:DNA-binding GntR family transcriptional regulator
MMVSAGNGQPVPLQIASVVDQVYAAIRERIYSGSLPRGSRVHQEDLAAELGVSRTPVLEMRTNRGARVADIDHSGMRTAYEARLVLEPGAARLAAQRRLELPLQQMAAAIAKQRRSTRSVGASFEANRAFHLALVAGSGNEFLLRFAERLWIARIGAAIYERQLKSQTRLALDIAEHEQILAAVSAGDARRAESLTRSHLTHAMRLSSDILGDVREGS